MTPRRRDLGPPGVLPVAAFATALLLLPFAGLLHRAPWSDLAGVVAGDRATDALVLSLGTATIATAISLILGLPLAWVLARADLPGKAFVRVLVILPMLLPPVVGGVALLFAFGRRGFIGERLESAFGIVLPFSTAGVVLAETFVAMPFLVIAVESGLRAAGRRYEDAAATLGASRWFALRHVTLPSIAPAVAAGAVLCWARALGEFGATITFAGNLQGRTQTMPLAILVALEEDRDAAIALSLVLIGIALTVLIALRNRLTSALQ